MSISNKTSVEMKELLSALLGLRKLSVLLGEEAEAEHVARERDIEIEREVRAAFGLERERNKAREHELRVLKLTKIKKDSQFDQSLNDTAMRLKLPQFKDGDDIVSFIMRFECIASLLKLDPNSYAVRIGNLVSGKALKFTLL